MKAGVILLRLRRDPCPGGLGGVDGDTRCRFLGVPLAGSGAKIVDYLLHVFICPVDGIEGTNSAYQGAVPLVIPVLCLVPVLDGRGDTIAREEEW